MTLAAAFLDSDALFLHEPLFCSMSSSTTDIEVTSSSLPSDDLWKKFDMMLPTPPVSPSHEISERVSLIDSDAEDLDLGLGDILGLDIPGFLDGNDADSDWLFEEIFRETTPKSLKSKKIDAAHQCGDLVGELRHDCMWAGHCPAEEHRLKKELPTLLSTSPTEATLLPTLLPREARRARLDTLGSLRPETPLSLSDSELDAEQLTSPDASSDDDEAKDAETSSDDNSEESEDDDVSEEEDDDVAETSLGRKTALSILTLPANIHPVRNHVRSSKSSSVKASLAASSTSLASMADHSYSHSDHSYHTQRRPNDNAALVADLLGIQTPSDSEEEIDVVSLGEVLRVTPSAASSKSCHVTSLQTVNAPIRLKLKVTPANSSTGSSSTTVLMRNGLPSHPSALVRQQLQLAVATAAQQRKHSDNYSSSSSSSSSSSHHHTSTLSSSCSSSRKSESSSKAKSSSGNTSSSSSSSSSKRARLDNSRLGTESGSSSPRKRSSRAGSDSEDSCEKRSQHNSMERQRRVDLRNAFEFLRSLIPDLEGTDRAAKVIILKKAANFCQGLTQREKQFVNEKDALQKRQEMLRKRLALLQRRR